MIDPILVYLWEGWGILIHIFASMLGLLSLGMIVAVLGRSFTKAIRFGRAVYRQPAGGRGDWIRRELASMRRRRGDDSIE